MLDTIKSLVTGKAPNAIEAARGKVNDATSELRRIEIASADAIAAARAAFEADPDDNSAADALSRAELRAELKLRKAREAIMHAQATLATLEREALDAQLAELDATVAGVRAKVDALASQAESQLRVVLDLMEKRDSFLREAYRASADAQRLRGQSHEEVRYQQLTIDSHHHVLSARTKDRLGLLNFQRLRDFFA